MSNPKEQIRWEILIVDSVRAGIFHSRHFASLETGLPSYICVQTNINIRQHFPSYEGNNSQDICGMRVLLILSPS